MKQSEYTFRQALNEVSASSSGGAPFLVCYGITFILTGILANMLPRETSALFVMFQGGVALPAAFWLERRLSKARMSPENPLTQLSMFLAVSQALAIPFLIVVYNIDPGQIPVVMAGLGGVHFLPYAWLHRTRIYVAVGVVIALGAFGLVLWLQTAAYANILFFVGVVYLIAAPLVYRHAKTLIDE
ncbi:MAG TPA: hypothetical protein VJ965_10675 [Anaerolineales bacterium]|nr:hypothetical protein [Anaerolineales bacterium]